VITDVLEEPAPSFYRVLQCLNQEDHNLNFRSCEHLKTRIGYYFPGLLSERRVRGRVKALDDAYTAFAFVMKFYNEKFSEGFPFSGFRFS
jgi:hypothetical protein